MIGTIQVITGGMFSGNSQELARRVERAVLADLRVVVCYPELSERQSLRDIGHRLAPWRDSLQILSVAAGDPGALPRDLLLGADVVAWDEVQFCPPTIVTAARQWRQAGKTVILAGLDMDFRGNPFGSMGPLLCMADHVIKMHAVCMRCKTQDAVISYRLSREADQVVVGESMYRAVCWECKDALDLAEPADVPAERRALGHLVRGY